jgi:hypothetical protein
MGGQEAAQLQRKSNMREAVFLGKEKQGVFQNPAPAGV